MTEALRVERPDEGVVLLTLAVPERRNALTAELTEAWVAQLAALAADSSVRAVVVTGEGSSFCSGGDLAWVEAGALELDTASIRARMQGLYKAWLGARELEVPVLAAVNGPAIGAGLCVALACDVRYASPAARFSMPFTRLGMHPGMAATYLLTEAVGVVAARELLYTGRVFGADEALGLGVVSRIRPAESLVADVVEIAAGIARTAPIATRLMKAGLIRGTARTFEEAVAWEALAQPVSMTTEDFREGFAAAREKRPPQFRGR